MRTQHPVFWILTLCLAFVLLLGIWILRRDAPGSGPTSPPTPRHTSSPTAPTPTVRRRETSSVTSGHRLAGTVVGDAQYAIVEDPHGNSELYHLGDMVSDLGEIKQIGPDRVLFEATDGLRELRLARAPTRTPTFPIEITSDPEDLPVDPTP